MRCTRCTPSHARRDIEIFPLVRATHVSSPREWQKSGTGVVPGRFTGTLPFGGLGCIPFHEKIYKVHAQGQPVAIAGSISIATSKQLLMQAMHTGNESAPRSILYIPTEVLIFLFIKLRCL